MLAGNSLKIRVSASFQMINLTRTISMILYNLTKSVDYDMMRFFQAGQHQRVPAQWLVLSAWKNPIIS